jgi:two-component system CheB/CheR fusion protein
MYFTADMQKRVLANFRFALTETGYLMLGKSEAMVTRTNDLDLVSLKHRVFRRKGRRDAIRPPLPELSPRSEAEGVTVAPGQLLSAGFETSPVAQLIVDTQGTVVAVNRRARSLFGLGLDSAGRAFKDLQVSYRPIELRSLVDEVLSTGRPATVHEAAWTTPGGDEEFLDMFLLPVEYDGLAGVSVTFMPVARYKALREELERSQTELETAYEEVQSTVEELETTNEELQSTNEELETTNEELHSTNEELETMNEELQSTNEELETANAELRERGRALDDSNRFQASILASLRSAVVVLNTEMTIRTWNRRAEDLWGLRAEEVEGSHFLNLDIGLPVDQLRSPIRAALGGNADGSEHHVPAVNRRGRSIDCTVQITPLRDGGEVFGAILVMDG